MSHKTISNSADTVAMLREKGLRKFTEVYSEDGKHMGVAMRFHHRSPEDVEPDLRLYRTYLELQSVEMGGTVFVPVDFVGDYDPSGNRLTLSVPLSYTEERLWNRKPDFVARGYNVREELAE